MTKTWDTKGRILELLGKKRMTLTELSETLGLAPSTVSQHIKELLSMGAIRQVDNPYVVKWKYYERAQVLDNAQAQPGAHAERQIMTPYLLRIVSGIVIVAVVAIALAALYMHLPSAPAAQQGAPNGTVVQEQLGAGAVAQGTTVFSISDTPTVAAVQAINITVDRAMIQNSDTGAWYVVFSGKEVFNLVVLKNISQLLSGAKLPNGTYDQVRLDISNVTAVVNNTATPIYIPSDTLRIFGNFNLSGGANRTSWVNLDVNLDRSLHMTANGALIMLPVLLATSHTNSTINVGYDGRLDIVSPGRVVANGTAAMAVNGSMGDWVTPMPLREQLDIGSDGRVVVEGNYPKYSAVFIHTPTGLLFAQNESNLTGVPGNIATNMVVTLRGTGIAGNRGTRERMLCEYDSGEKVISCTLNGTANSRLPEMIISDGRTLFPAGSVNGGATTVDANLTINGSSINGTEDIGPGAGGGWQGGLVLHVNSTGVSWENGTQAANLQQNTSWYSCTTSAQCTIEPATYCQNGLPSQSACVNSAYAGNYMQWYSASVEHSSQPCPLFVVHIPIGCGCVDGACKVVPGTVAALNSSISENSSIAGDSSSAVSGGLGVATP